jgi:hypothetical protein
LLAGARIILMTSMYDVPDGWLDPKSSRGPLVLVNSYALADSTSPPLDQWSHYAKLRPLSRNLVIGCAVIVFVSAYGAVWTILASIRESLLWLGWSMGVVLVISTLFFGTVLVASVISNRKRADWPNLHGVGIGSRGSRYGSRGMIRTCPGVRSLESRRRSRISTSRRR